MIKQVYLVTYNERFWYADTLEKQKHWRVNLWHLLVLLVRQELAAERKVKNEYTIRKSR